MQRCRRGYRLEHPSALGRLLLQRVAGRRVDGAKPGQAFFVGCDPTTMTQNDLDKGRLVCLVGVAVVKPAEFVLFRIGRWTADGKV